MARLFGSFYSVAVLLDAHFLQAGEGTEPKGLVVNRNPPPLSCCFLSPPHEMKSISAFVPSLRMLEYFSYISGCCDFTQSKAIQLLV